MQKTKSIIWGIALIILGIIFGGNAIGIFNIDIFFDGWWTLFIIVPSAISLFTEKEKLSSLFFVAIGVCLLLAAQNVFSYDVAWKVILAIFLVGLGLTAMFKGAIKGKDSKEVDENIEKLKSDENDAQIAIFSGSEHTYNNEKFSSANIVAVFGGAGLDLRNAIIKKDTYIKAFCLFGGVDIKVPKDVCIKTKSGFIFGGISDDRKDSVETGKYTLYIDAAGGFGGVSISDKEEKKKT